MDSFFWNRKNDSEDGARSPGAESRATEDYFQEAELFSNQVADDVYQADFTTAVALLGAFCVTPHPLHLLNSSVSYNPIPGLLQWDRYVIFWSDGILA